MSATDLETSPAKRYFDAIEKHFLELRQAGVILTEGDFALVKSWFEREVPLDLVLGTLDQTFARHRERKRKSKISSLRYCAPAIERAFEEIAALTHAGRTAEAEPLRIEPRLAALAAALPAALPSRQEWAERITALRGAAAEVEAQLAALGAELLAALERAASPELSAEISRHVAALTAPLAARVPAAELAATRERLRQRELRARHGLAVLSLFAPEALPPEAR